MRYDFFGVGLSPHSSPTPSGTLGGGSEGTLKRIMEIVFEIITIHNPRIKISYDFL